MGAGRKMHFEGNTLIGFGVLLPNVLSAIKKGGLASFSKQGHEALFEVE